METGTDIPCCAIPSETALDVVPLVVVAGVFLLLGILLRHWKKRRNPPVKK